MKKVFHSDSGFQRNMHGSRKWFKKITVNMIPGMGPGNYACFRGGSRILYKVPGSGSRNYARFL
jgi:hypothetical protein